MKKTVLIVLLYCTTCFTANAQYSALFSFDNHYDGYQVKGSLISDGTYLYGMTRAGGSLNDGDIFRIRPDGTGFSILFEFTGNNGSYPNGSLISDGTFLYGATAQGGIYGWGTIFKILPDGTSFTKLYDFSGSVTDGAGPMGNLFYDGTFLYGMGFSGGANYYGTIFKIMPDGTHFSKLHDFSSLTDGAFPRGSLISDGTYLYGMTGDGAINSEGTIFKIMPDGTGFTVLTTFAGTSNGAYGYGNLIYDGTFLYGIATHGGANGQGIVFRLMPDGTAFTILISFIASSANQNNSLCSLITDGTYLYGMTTNGGVNNLGRIFRLMPDGSGYSDLFSFNNSFTGNTPYGSLYYDGSFFYGMTSAGGAYNGGTIFKFHEYPAGVTENNLMNTDCLFPNPSNGIFTLNSEITAGEISICNLFGEIIFQSTINNQTSSIDLSDKPNGIYFITVKTEKDSFTQKIIIEK